MNIDELMAQRDQLDIQIRDAEQAAKAAEKARIEAIVKGFEWRVLDEADKYGPYAIRIECRYDEATRQQLPNDKSAEWHGMSYYLINNVLVSFGGGSVIITEPANRWHQSRVLTDEQRDALQQGIVPENMRKPW